MMADVLAFPNRGHEPSLTKRQLANHLGRSTRWIEMRVREGMPADWDRFHQERRFNLRAVETWLRERAA